MSTLEFIGEVIVYLGGLLAIFEFFPPAQRNAIDNYVNKTLTWSLLGTLLFLAALLHVGIRIFPYISPIIVFIACIVLRIFSRAIGLYMLKDDEARSGCLLLLVMLPLAALAAWLVSAPELQLFSASLMILVASLIIAAVRADSDFAKGNLVLTFLGFLLVAAPSGLGHWVKSPYVDVLMSPYSWLAGTFRSRTHALIADILAPQIHPGVFELAYDSTANAIRSMLPGFLVNFQPFLWFELSGGGYLLIFAVLVQILFLVYAWHLIRILLLAPSVPLIRLSDSLKKRLGIQQRRIPIAGALLLLSGSTLLMIIKSVKYFS